MTHRSKAAVVGMFAALSMINGVAGAAAAVADPGGSVITTIFESPQTSGVCPPLNGFTIVITDGNIDCAAAADVAGRFDLHGDRHQRIGPFQCDDADAWLDPLAFTCSTDTADKVVFEANF
jgi:hypothetical protein